MASLNQISNYIARKLNKVNDYAVIQQAKFAVKQYRALELRRSVEKDGVEKTLRQRIVVELVKVDKADNCYIDVGCKILKTKNPFPRPIRIKGGAPFLHVGLLAGFEDLTYTTLQELKFTKHNKYTFNIGRYDYIDNHIYVFNKTKLAYLEVIHYFEDLEGLINYCDSECYDDNSEFPIALDLIPLMVQSILANEFKLVTENEEINFKE